MYCKNCGQLLSDESEVCLNCGFAEGTGDKHCGHCGAPVEKEQFLCVKCGFLIGGRKKENPLEQSKELDGIVKLKILLNILAIVVALVLAFAPMITFEPALGDIKDWDQLEEALENNGQQPCSLIGFVIRMHNIPDQNKGEPDTAFAVFRRADPMSSDGAIICTFLSLYGFLLLCVGMCIINLISLVKSVYVLNYSFDNINMRLSKTKQHLIKMDSDSTGDLFIFSIIIMVVCGFLFWWKKFPISGISWGLYLYIALFIAYIVLRNYIVKLRQKNKVTVVFDKTRTVGVIYTGKKK